MKNNIQLNKKQIIVDYVNNRISINNLANKYHIGKNKIRNILSENDIPIRKRGGQKNSIITLS